MASQAGAQTVSLTFSGFDPPVTGVSYLRCRIANAAGEVDNPTGAAATGEVEDYPLTIGELDYGDLPDPTANTGAGRLPDAAGEQRPAAPDRERGLPGRECGRRRGRPAERRGDGRRHGRRPAR